MASRDVREIRGKSRHARNRGGWRRPLPRRVPRLSTCTTVSALFFAFLACAKTVSEPVDSAGESSPPGLTITEARAHLMPGMGTIYLSVVNSGDRDRMLSVETPVAHGAETHETVDENGVLRMVPRPQGFEVPSNSTLELKPQGKHIMLFEPQPGAAERDTLLLRIHFEKAGTIEIEVPVKELGG